MCWGSKSSDFNLAEILVHYPKKVLFSASCGKHIFVLGLGADWSCWHLVLSCTKDTWVLWPLTRSAPVSGGGMVLCDPVHQGSTATQLPRRWQTPWNESLMTANKGKLFPRHAQPSSQRFGNPVTANPGCAELWWHFPGCWHALTSPPLPVCSCRGCRTCTTTSTAPTWRLQRLWTLRSVSLGDITGWHFMGR